MLKKIKRMLQWMVGLFFGSTILAVIVLRFVPVWFTPLMFIRLGEQLADGRELAMHHHWVPLSEIAPELRYAVIGSEDANFYDHHGFDFDAIMDAAKRNKQNPQKNRHGGSTISQQTAKNVFLWPSRTWLRKGLESYFTVLIELAWGKDRIMEVYLNSIEMSDGIYGADAVAEYHFHCRASELNARQCALIAASLPNPRKYNSAAPTPYMRKRQRAILRDINYLKNKDKRKDNR